MSKSELADELGIARSGVSKLIGRGLPVRVDGQIDLLEACTWIANNNVEGGGVVAKAREWIWLLNKSRVR